MVFAILGTAISAFIVGGGESDSIINLALNKSKIKLCKGNFLFKRLKKKGKR
jgi:hypothetical protein